ncbi:MAG TPA: chemotaxis protein CheB [Rhodanobacteraceae bacterium]|nr:chemotaxis protein CheB [Rhodanobacteraceae bacterium]
MAESMASPGVALLFADADLGAHLREALVALGARIVYEGAAAQAQPEALAKSGADVVVVNLEPAEDEHFDRLHALLEQGSQRVVFNDAEASRNLSGWDKARWARHLAVKLIGSGDVDPPRPTDARQVETQTQGGATPHQAPRRDTPGVAPAAPAPKSAPVSDDPAVLAQENTESELLSAELEALLTGEDDTTAADDTFTGNTPAPPATSDVHVEQRQTVSVPEPVTDWSLDDMDIASPAPAEPDNAKREDASRFGIEKMQAADFLKPEDGDDDMSIEPGLKLELVSLEESVSPTMVDKTVSEMVLDAGPVAVRRVVLVGAGQDAAIELAEFFAGLPGALPALVLIAQHQQNQHAEALAAALDTSTRLPVRVAEDGVAARLGEAWLVPAGHRCHVERDGRMSLASADAVAQADPSIDQCMDTLASVFGADMTAIVLAGDGEDGLAGARAVTERGGRVWILDPASGGSQMGMAARIQEEGLATFSGSPTDLARRLAEECA